LKSSRTHKFLLRDDACVFIAAKVGRFRMTHMVSFHP
jgi:hypothetical protein